jgi:16S rRNA (cytosine1402-N4)-methyltransferase
VLLRELVESLDLRPGDTAIDCTLGFGGHTEALLEKVGNEGRVIGIDRDKTALDLAGKRLAGAVRAGRLTLVQANFSELATVARSLKLEGAVKGIAADLGVSSMHLDDPARGFSFRFDGPLDMRMDQTRGGRTAADLVRDLDEAELVHILREYGEEPKARQIARAIVKERATTPITTTGHLANLVDKAAAWREPSRRHPATRAFQALRIAVNDELGELKTLLESALAVLRPTGRLAVITFHSLEDRLVKETFTEWSGKRAAQRLPRGLPMTGSEVAALSGAVGKIIKPFPGAPSDAETASNPRARSARLRTIEKLALS